MIQLQFYLQLDDNFVETFDKVYKHWNSWYDEDNNEMQIRMFHSFLNKIINIRNWYYNRESNGFMDHQIINKDEIIFILKCKDWLSCFNIN